MAIQFRCPGCSQPIEVDEQHAGQEASCPYCRVVVTVPEISTYRAELVPAARPAEEGAARDADAVPPPPPPGSLHVGSPLTPRERTARSLGTWALVCSALVVLLFGVWMLQYLARVLEKAGIGPTTTQPIERAVIEEATRQALEELAGEPAFLVPSFGSMFFGVVGAALAITSLVQSARRNWRGIVGLVICGLYVLCLCGGALINIGFGAGATGA